MTKDDTQMLKGVAILLMLWLHLFNRIENVDLCHNLVSLHGKPLAHFLAGCADPVAFFLFLSGYGLYKSYSATALRQHFDSTSTALRQHFDSTSTALRQHHALSEVLSRNLRRVLKVYIYYWITLAVFIPLGCWMYGYGTYPGDIVTLLENITAWRTSYNGEIWFLFPYILLVFSSVPLYRLVDRYHWLVILLCSYTLVLFNTLLGNTPIYGMLARSVRPIYYVLLTSNLAFSFLLGMVTARHLDIANLKAFFRGKAWIGYLMLLAIVVARLLGFIMHPLYATIIIIVFTCMPHLTITRKALQELGRRSTSMWFIHSWFCYYLFHDWVYSFKYPLLIFAVLVAVSYLCAIPVDWLQKRIWSRING